MIEKKQVGENSSLSPLVWIGIINFILISLLLSKTFTNFLKQYSDQISLLIGLILGASAVSLRKKSLLDEAIRWKFFKKELDIKEIYLALSENMFTKEGKYENRWSNKFVRYYELIGNYMILIFLPLLALLILVSISKANLIILDSTLYIIISKFLVSMDSKWSFGFKYISSSFAIYIFIKNILSRGKYINVPFCVYTTSFKYPEKIENAIYLALAPPEEMLEKEDIEKMGYDPKSDVYAVVKVEKNSYGFISDDLKISYYEGVFLNKASENKEE